MRCNLQRIAMGVIVSFAACCGTALSAGPSVAFEEHAWHVPVPPSPENCYLITTGQKPLDCKILKKYSGYYKLNDTTFYHVFWNGQLYLLMNDTYVHLLRRKSKTQFVYDTNDRVHVIFEGQLDGAPKFLRIHNDPDDNYTVEADKIKSQVEKISRPDEIVVRISEYSAHSIYTNVQENNKKWQEKFRLESAKRAEARAPHPSQLSKDVLEKIKMFIVDEIDALGKLDPHFLVTGVSENIEYLGLSPQGEQVLKVERERGIEYWLIKLDSKDEIRSVFFSSSL